jgi:hypothetical protein
MTCEEGRQRACGLRDMAAPNGDLPEQRVCVQMMCTNAGAQLAAAAKVAPEAAGMLATS